MDTATEKAQLVGIIMGSESDMPVMEGCTAELDALGVPYELVIASAHRNPAKVHEWAESAADRGIKVIVAAAGKAAHLGGVVAAFTPLPVIGVPMKTSDLGGLDSLLSMVQMPSGVPVACVAINGAKNAAIYATQILGATMPECRDAIAQLKRDMAEA
ncbi:5-(carboxyamino)imidazole ribonucleotide mutase [Collinsella stercoris]|uniref:5-(carboxyamino)imidazole ribonucleotide mutase n=1 Tax=Collinsella stercoris TaxID=147206 RepID=UPI0039966E22